MCSAPCAAAPPRSPLPSTPIVPRWHTTVARPTPHPARTPRTAPPGLNVWEDRGYDGAVLPAWVGPDPQVWQEQVTALLLASGPTPLAARVTTRPTLEFDIEAAADAVLALIPSSPPDRWPCAVTRSGRPWPWQPHSSAGGRLPPGSDRPQVNPPRSVLTAQKMAIRMMPDAGWRPPDSTRRRCSVC